MLPCSMQFRGSNIGSGQDRTHSLVCAAFPSHLPAALACCLTCLPHPLTCTFACPSYTFLPPPHPLPACLPLTCPLLPAIYACLPLPPPSTSPLPFPSLPCPLTLPSLCTHCLPLLLCPCPCLTLPCPVHSLLLHALSLLVFLSLVGVLLPAHFATFTIRIFHTHTAHSIKGAPF